MSRGIRFSVDTERTLEHLEEDLFASSRRRALPREKGKLTERRNASSCTLRLSDSWFVGFARRDRCAANAWYTRDYAVRSISSNHHRTPLKRRRTRATAATE